MVVVRGRGPRSGQQAGGRNCPGISIVSVTVTVGARSFGVPPPAPPSRQRDSLS